MGSLITKRTNLKSIKFGNDRPGGGSSNQPYIQTPIPEGDPSVSSGLDFLTRGGELATQHSIFDTSRIGKMLADTKSPNGFLFIAKQNLLSKTSVKTETLDNPNQGIYNPLNTLLQTAGNAFGLHTDLFITKTTYEEIVKTNNKSGNNRLTILLDKKLNTQNLSPNIITYSGGPGSLLGIGETNIKFADQRTGANNPNNPEINKGIYQTKRWNNRTKNELISPITNGASGKYIDFTGLNKFNNPLIFPDGEPVLTADAGYTYEPNFNTKTTISGSLKPIDEVLEGTYQVGGGNKNINTELYSPSGSNSGASSKYKTLLNKVNQKSLFNNERSGMFEKSVYTQGNTFPENDSKVIGENNTQTLSQIQLINKIINQGTQLDFREDLLTGKNNSSVLSLSPSYKTKNIERRVNLGDPGRDNTGNGTKDVYFYETSKNILDKINASAIYTNNIPNHNGENNDLVKFSIGILNGNASGSASYMNFRAFIDSFSDSYNGNWNDTQYSGRGDKFYNYVGFDRKISLGFTLYAQSKAELIPMYKKLNFLASSVMPNYSGAGFMRGNLARLTVGGYLFNQLGIINSFTYDVPQETTWEIGINTDGDSDHTVKELPHMIKVTSFNFTPIQEFLPRLADPGYQGDTRYIALSTNTGAGNYIN